MLDTSNRTCPGCGSSGQRDLPQYSLDEWRVVACTDCGFVYLSNPPGYEALEEEYGWEKTSAAETERRLETRGKAARLSKSTRWRLRLFGFTKKQLDRYFRSGNALDIGCGNGVRLLETGAVPHGVEISRELNRVANEKMKERGGYSIQAPAVEGVRKFPEDYFDSVLMHSFLEHEEQPGPLLDSLHRVLKKGGVIYVRVPNYGSINRMVTGQKWCGFRYPDHVNYFTIPTLKKMAHDHGYSFKLLNPITVPVNDNIKALLTKI